MHRSPGAAEQDTTTAVQLHQWHTQHRDERISTQQHASNQKTADYNASAKLEETLGELQQMYADNAEAEASHRSAEKEYHTVEQTERHAAQAAQQAILHDIHTAVDSISKRRVSASQSRSSLARFRTWHIFLMMIAFIITLGEIM